MDQVSLTHRVLGHGFLAEGADNNKRSNRRGIFLSPAPTVQCPLRRFLSQRLLLNVMLNNHQWICPSLARVVCFVTGNTYSPYSIIQHCTPLCVTAEVLLLLCSGLTAMLLHAFALSL